ncbi:hypothetical protein B0H13DRAFT_2235986 [Mycena leptocephala]|nr:hypothetical protein B0H13DRAFT_2235986 [Mycena leptocephala]
MPRFCRGSFKEAPSVQSTLESLTLCVLYSFFLLLATCVLADDIAVYSDAALAAGWENWSWSSDINFAATDVFEGSSSISVNSQAWSALSVKLEGTFPDYQGLRFDIAVPSLPDAFTSLLIDFRNLPGSGAALGDGTWDRITWQAGANGDVYHIDNIVVVESIIIPPLFLWAEPLAANTIAVTTQGDVDFSTFAVSLNRQSVKILNITTYTPVSTPSKSITYLTLAKNFVQGSLVIDTGVPNGGNPSFNVTLPAVQYASFVQQVNFPILPLIYGVNFPTSASYIQDLSVTMSRWGGNTVTAYNPAGDFTNAGADWFFENRVADPGADDWVAWVHGAGSQSLLTVPALHWVSKDAISYSYPVSEYPASADPFLATAGSGRFPNGSAVGPPPDPTTVYTPWNTTMANKPTLVAIDNEIEIASTKEAILGVKVAAPSTCTWWFYWTSEVGYTDNAAHDNMDFLSWFLMKMAAAEKTHGQRILDYLDVHYYYAADTSANDGAAKALRLRMTRKLPMGPTIVSLLPRFRTLIDIYYPGTKLSVSEFSSTADTDITGGLVTVDLLGMFGRQKLDSATYWVTPDELGPVGLAYWLYRGFGVNFGANSAQVNLATPNPNTQGAYAATENGKFSVVIVNKNPDTPITFALANMPFGSYFMRHFGGEAGIAKCQTTVTISSIDYIVVPAYTAVFLKQN